MIVGGNPSVFSIKITSNFPIVLCVLSDFLNSENAALNKKSPDQATGAFPK